MNTDNAKEIIAAFTTKACTAIKISFVCPLHHVSEIFDSEYRPEFTHQIFGPNEDIFGYKNLEIRIAYSETTGHCFVKVRYSEVVNSLGLIPDDIWQKLRPVLPHEYDRDYYEYAERQKTNEVYQKVFGIPKYKFGCQTGEDHFDIFTARLCSLNEDGFKEVHNRFQTLLIWYIDGANLIDLDDPNWEIIYLYTYHYGKNGPPTVTGFCTIYKFFAYPDKIRARISQFIIFPPYRRCGVGVRFLRCVYKIIHDTIPNLKDITVEDPNKEFRMIRSINNVAEIFFSPVMTKFKVRDPNNTELLKEISSVFKFSQKECNLYTDLITYMCASVNRINDIKKIVMSRLKDRISNEYVRVGRHFRNSIQFNRHEELSEDFMGEFKEHKDEFLLMATVITRKISDNMRVTKIE